MAALFPETTEGLLDLMARRFPEPRYDPSQTAEEIRHALARRSVYLELRDAYELSRRKDHATIVRR